MNQTLKTRDLPAAITPTQIMDDDGRQECLHNLVHEINNIQTALSCRWELFRNELNSDVISASSLAEVEQSMLSLSTALRSLMAFLTPGA